MIFTLKNIGPISSATLELNGITLIAGENGSGKSTIEKAVALALSSLYNISDYIQSERAETIYRTLSKGAVTLDAILKKMSGSRRRHRSDDTNRLQQNYARRIAGNIPIDDRKLSDIIEEYAIEHASYYSVDQSDLHRSDEYQHWITEIVLSVKEDTLYTDDDIGRSSVTDAVDRFFASQIVKFDAGREQSMISTQDAGVKNVMQFERQTKMDQDICSELSLESPVTEPVLFISSPNVFDGIFGLEEYDNSQMIQTAVRFLLSPGNAGISNEAIGKKDFWNSLSPQQTAIEKDQNRRLTDKFYHIIESTVQGHLEITSSRRMQFVPLHAGRTVEMANVSTGVKALSILAYAMEQGCITNGSVLLLDEPEINLHPEWQLKYAEILVQMQQDMNLRIMMTTHSPYFAEAIAAYSCKYGREKLCRYYPTKCLTPCSYIQKDQSSTPTTPVK